MAENPLPSPEFLRKVLQYEPQTGELFWRKRDKFLMSPEKERKRWNSRYAGKPALASLDTHGYRSGSIKKKSILAHKAIWAIVYGHWPEKPIDHINGIRTDNRIANLRLVDPAENSRNQFLSPKNKSGTCGVHWCKTRKKWIAQIGCNGRRIYIGGFDRIEDARNARKSEEQRCGFSERHGQSMNEIQRIAAENGVALTIPEEK